jgi:nucleotide-binding universal stress UspA family protein
VESIVLGFDGGETSLVALDWVAVRAADHASRVEIVMIGGSILGDDYPTDTRLLDAERRLQDVAPDAEVDSHRLTGRMPDSLIERAREADLLVIGARRGHPLRSAMAGWMPLRIASRSRTPVVVVPQHWEPSAERFVVGVDDDDSSLAAVDFAAREAAAARAPLVLVHTWQMPVAQLEGSVALLPSPIEARAGHRKILRDIVQRVESVHPGVVTVQVLEQGSPASSLLQATRGASLLVIGTHHRGLLAGALLGSTGQDVLSQCRIPVCVVPSVTSN